MNSFIYKELIGLEYHSYAYVTGFLPFLFIFSRMSFVICISLIVSQLLYAIRLVSRYIYAFYSLFLGLSPAHTLICVTFISIIYALYSLLGLSLAHIPYYLVFMLFRLIYAFYSL